VQIPRFLTNLIPSSAHDIIGREKELVAIQQHLSVGQPTVLVNGIGGIGKTSVATKYMATCGGSYAHLAWLTVSGTLQDAFIQDEILLGALDIEAKVKELVSAAQIDTAFKTVLFHLNQLQNTLIVLDNANELADLVRFRQLLGRTPCHYILTSRSEPQGWTIVPIEELPETEAVALFKRHYPAAAAIAEQEIKALLEKLFYHTLLIELVAKAAEISDISFSDLIHIINNEFIYSESLNELEVGTGLHGGSLALNEKEAKIEHYIFKVFSNLSDINELSKQILKAFSLLPTTTSFEKGFLEEHFSLFELQNGWRQNVEDLFKRGWLEKVKKDGNASQFKMHPLIADVIIKQLAVSADYADAYIKQVWSLIHYDTTDPSHDLFKKREYQYLAERLEDLFKAQETANMANLLDRLGYLNENFGFYAKAAEQKERALHIASSIFEPNHSTIAKYQSNLANVYRELGRYTEAADLLEKVLESAIKNLGLNHSWIAIYQSSLALVYHKLDRYAEAADLLEAALQSAIANFGETHPEVAIKQSNLALVYRDLGRYAEAADLLEAALQSDIANFGETHPSVARCQSNLALVYRKLGRNAEAADLLATALQSDIANFGKTHPVVAIKKWNLATVYIELNQKAEAKVLLYEAHAIYMATLGKEHPDTKAVESWFPAVED
jgi:tetratricopeptide (TPR) repeat protein